MRTMQKATFAIANTCAVLAALYVAFAANLERPYWAMFSVFVIAKPISGAVRSKATFRLTGTLVGAAMAVFLVPPLVQAPALLCLAVSIWVGLCVYCSVLDRTPRSYAFMLAGYTVAIVGFSVVNTPESVFDTAVARVEEIGLGIICGAVAHSVIFPQSVTDELKERIKTLVRSCAQWIADLPPQPCHLVDLLAQRRFATAVTESHLLYTHVAFETSDAPRARLLMRTLEERIAVLLPRASAVQRNLAALSAVGAKPAALTSLIAQVSRWAHALVREGKCSAGAMREQSELQQQCAAALKRLDCSPPGWPVLLEQSAIVELSELTQALADCSRLAAALEEPNPRLPVALEKTAKRSGSRALSADRGLGLLSGIAAACATLIACVLWIGGSWPEGLVAAQFAAIGASLFAALDNPAEPILPAVAGILLALPFAALYEFALFPRIHGFPSLALVLSPALLLFSFMQTFRRLEGTALVLAIAFSGALALAPSYQADFASFLNTNAAEIVGLLLAGVAILALRTVDPLWNARRLSRAGWQSLSRLARHPRPSFERWLIQMFDRLGLIAVRLVGTKRESTALREIDALQDLRVGLGIDALRKVGTSPGAANGTTTQALLEAIARAYEERLRGARDRASAAVAQHIDTEIAAVCAQPPSATRHAALAALTSLRLELLPNRAPHAALGRPA